MTITDTKKRRVENSEEDNVYWENIKKYINRMSYKGAMNFLLDQAKKNKELCEDIIHNNPDSKKLFLRNIKYETKEETIRSVMSRFGELEECSVIKDKHTEKYKGFAFVTFKDHKSVDEALEQQQVEIDDREVYIHLASERNERSRDRIYKTYVNKHQPYYYNNSAFVSNNHLNTNNQNPALNNHLEDERKLFVRNLAHKTDSEMLRSGFQRFGEIENATVIFDKFKQSSKCYGFVLFKNVESIKKALEEPEISIDGQKVHCHKASERKKAPIKGNYSNESHQHLQQINNGYNPQPNASTISYNPSTPYNLYHSNESFLNTAQMQHQNNLDIQYHLQQLHLAHHQISQKLNFQNSYSNTDGQMHQTAALPLVQTAQQQAMYTPGGAAMPGNAKTPS